MANEFVMLHFSSYLNHISVNLFKAIFAVLTVPQHGKVIYILVDYRENMVIRTNWKLVPIKGRTDLTISQR